MVQIKYVDYLREKEINGIIFNCPGHSKHRKKSLEYVKNSVDFSEKTRIIWSCMNTKKDSRIPQCGSLPDLSKERIVVGAKQLRKALTSDRAQSVFLAENADPAITEPIAQMCMDKGIEFTWVATMADLGRACGIEVGAAAAATVA